MMECGRRWMKDFSEGVARDFAIVPWEMWG